MQDSGITVEPLPYRQRQWAFSLLVALFVISLPFLYLYATGYRFDLNKPTQLISTGGIYLAVQDTGAEIYIDDELVRETRTFRRAFYAQNIDVGTHRIHVQKEGFHTWVKELPVSKHLVTEAEAFNLPLVPQVRIISEWQTATGTPVVRTTLLTASTTQEVVVASTTMGTSTLVRNTEYQALMVHFSTTTATSSVIGEGVATSTIVAGGVELARSGEDLYATWIGSFENMPYYYCAPDFPRYSTSTPTTSVPDVPEIIDRKKGEVLDPMVMHPLQTLAPDAPCEPSIRIDRKWQTVRDFDFYPGTTDIVIVVLEDGIYAVEVDDRAWQNTQPIMQGQNLAMHIENGTIYVYDGRVIYQVLLATE